MFVVLQEARKSCLLVNGPLIIRAASKVPYSVLKYAMTLDGKCQHTLMLESVISD